MMKGGLGFSKVIGYGEKGMGTGGKGTGGKGGKFGFGGWRGGEVDAPPRVATTAAAASVVASAATATAASVATATTPTTTIGGGKAVMRIAHLGDCMGMLIRGEQVVWRTEEMWWNVCLPLPFPLSSTKLN